MTQKKFIPIWNENESGCWEKKKRICNIDFPALFHSYSARYMFYECRSISYGFKNTQMLVFNCLWDEENVFSNNKSCAFEIYGTWNDFWRSFLGDSFVHDVQESEKVQMMIA